MAFAVLKSWMFVLKGFMLIMELGGPSWSPVIYDQKNFILNPESGSGSYAYESQTLGYVRIHISQLSF
jgi:hypothetical protein